MPEPSKRFINAVAFNCGALSLALEIVLARLALRELGSGAMAATATITLFLAGLAAGALIAQRLSTKQLWHSARAVPLALSVMAQLLSAYSRATFSSGYLIIFIFLFLSGALSALIVSALGSLASESETVNGSARANTVYFYNNLGCVFGTALTAFVLLPLAGISGTLLAAGLAGMFCFVGCLQRFTFKMPTEYSQDTAATISEPAGSEKLSAASAIVLFGSALMLTVLECDFIRIASMVSGSASQTISAALLCIIAAMSGGNAFALWLIKIKRASAARPFALAAVAATTLLTMYTTPALSQIFQEIRIALSAMQWLQNIPTASYLVPRLIVMALLTAPSSFCLGLVYPLYTSALSKDEWRKAFAISSSGAIVGPALFTFFILDLPVQSPLIETLKVAAIVAAVAAIFAALTHKNQPKIALVAVTKVTTVLAALTIAAGAVNFSFIRQTMVSGYPYFPAERAAIEQVKLEQTNMPLTFYKEGKNATVSIEENTAANLRILKSDGKVEATIPLDVNLPARGSDLSTQYLLSLMPAVMCAGDNINCLIIGQGSGTTSSVAAVLPRIAKVQVVELEEAMNEAALQFNPHLARYSVKNINADARALLKSKQKYDLIISQPSEPYTSGSAGLFTREFFNLQKESLTDRGLVAQWLQLYGLPKEELITALETFNESFPGFAIVHQSGAGEIILIGAKNARSLNADADQQSLLLFLTAPYRQLFARAGVAGLKQFNAMKQTNYQQVATVLSRFDRSINTDDNLKLEFGRGRLLIDDEGEQERRLGENLQLVDEMFVGKARASMPFAQSVEKGDDEIDKELARDEFAYLYINARAKNLLMRAQADQAKVLLDKSISIYPSLGETHLLLALAEAMMGKLEKALKETQEAHLLNVQDCRPYLVAACIYEARGDYDDARSNLNIARQKCPNDEILNQIGVAEKTRPSAPAKSSSEPGTLKSKLIRLLKASESL